MKKFIGFFVTVLIFVMCSTLVYAQEFVTKSIEYKEGETLFQENWQKYSHIMMRYKDTKEPIPLSMYYDGFVFATVPRENMDRECEVFISEDINFSDYNESDYEFYPMVVMSSKGIVKGDEQGNAFPYRNVTRAEATAMVMRFLGIDSFDITDSGFKDVPEDEWFAGTISKAKEMGIVVGDTKDSFSPNRSVSREEVAVMLARASEKAGLIKIDESITYQDFKNRSIAEDTDKISSWALPAYDALTSYYCVSYDFTYDEDKVDEEGVPITHYFINADCYAARYEIAEMIMRAIENMQIYPSQTAKEFGFDKKMPVIDGSTSTYPFTEAIYNTLFANGYRHPEKPVKHSKSYYSYQRLINGEVDAIIASVYPAEDILKEAEEKGVELELIPIAYDAMIFFTNKDNPSEGLTKQQISEIYVDNKYSNWKEIGGADALLYPYCRNNDSGSHAQMERHFLHGKEINEKIRNETTSITMSNVLTDVMGAETQEPLGYGLGYSIYYYFKNMDVFYETDKYLKLLKIDGIAPTPETIADGTYPLSNNTYVVIKKSDPEDAISRKFAEFMLTDKGQECVELAGFGRLK